MVVDEFDEAFVGEEGTRLGSGTKTWIVDPIDGTKNFLRGMPVWATLIAVTDGDETLAAVVSAPALGRRWWAAKGEGAWTRDVDGTERRLHVSGVSSLDDAFLLHASLFSWDTSTSVGSSAIIALLSKAWRHRGIGDFFNYMLVAEGAADATLEGSPKLWDVAAPFLIVQEAGGTVWTNASADTLPEQPRITLATNGPLEPLIKPVLENA
jgi:histidinol-phosphatase